MSKLIIGGIFFALLIVGAILCCLAAAGQLAWLHDLFRANGKLTDQNADGMAWCFFGALACLSALVVFWFIYPRFSPRACASLRPRFDPQKLFFVIFIVGAVCMVSLMTFGSWLAESKYDAVIVSIVSAIIIIGLYGLLLWIVAAPSCRLIMHRCRR